MIASALALLGLLAAPAFAAPSTTESAASSAASVLTPRGMRPAANVHQVPTGGTIRHVNDEIHLLDAEGNVVNVATNDHAPVGTAPSGTSTRSAVEPLETGWIAYAGWYNSGDPISQFWTTWNVPNTPSAWDGQTLFYFNSIEPASFDAILQPVLQYGGSAAGGGEYWATATWYLVGSNTYYTTPAQTSVGTALTGIVQLDGGSGSAWNYTSGFEGGDGLYVAGAEELVWATLTLEVYSVEQQADFPTGSTSFYSTNIQVTTNGAPSMSWDCTSDTTDNIDCSVPADGSVNAEVTITYF